MPLLGAHESVGKGLHRAFARIDAVGGEALQIFTRNQRQWHPKPLEVEEIDRFAAAWQEHPGMVVASHASYLVNLATGKPELRHKSVSAFVEELRRCHLLRLPYVVLHPGSHGGDGIEEGLARFVGALDEAIETAASDTMVLIETTAGQGTGLGSRFEELACIRASSRFPDKIGICLDTCHIFAAGYDIRDAESYRRTMDRFASVVGLEHLRLFHLNDSRKGLGARVDRHEHIGAGAIGKSGFSLLLNDERFAGHAMLLETPKGEDLVEDIENLDVLRRLMTG